MEDSRVLVPLRPVFEALGAKISWDEASKTVYAEKGEENISLVIGKPYININGKSKKLDVPPKIIEGRTFVPARAISEGLGATVTWDEAKRTVGIYMETNPGEGNQKPWETGIFSSKTLYFLMDLTSGKEWTLSFSFDTPEENIVTLSQSSDKKYIRVYSNDGNDISLVLKNARTYVMINSEKVYYPLDSGGDLPDAILGTAGLIFPLETEGFEKMASVTFKKGFETLDGIEYYYEEFTDGADSARFYFLNDELSYVSGESYGSPRILAKITGFSRSSEASFFDIPPDYIMKSY